MDFKKLFRGPIIYIVIAVIGIGIGWSVISASGTTQRQRCPGTEDPPPEASEAPAREAMR